MTNSVKTKPNSSSCPSLALFLLFLSTFKTTLLRKAKSMAPDPKILRPNFLTMPLHFRAKRVIRFSTHFTTDLCQTCAEGKHSRAEKNHVPTLQQPVHFIKLAIQQYHNFLQLPACTQVKVVESKAFKLLLFPLHV